MSVGRGPSSDRTQHRSGHDTLASISFGIKVAKQQHVPQHLYRTQALDASGTFVDESARV